MEINFAPSFGDNIETLVKHNTWWYKIYELFRYDLPRFFKNIWRFRKALWNHHWWDHHGVLQFLEIGLTHISNNIETYGYEVNETRLKKVAAMRRAIELIKNYNQALYIDMAEKELGKLIFHDWEFEEIPDNPGYSKLIDNDTPEEKEHNRKIFNRANEIEKQEWDELFNILKGQDYTKFDKNTDWDKEFDGSGIKSWWD